MYQIVYREKWGEWSVSLDDVLHQLYYIFISIVFCVQSHILQKEMNYEMWMFNPNKVEQFRNPRNTTANLSVFIMAYLGNDIFILAEKLQHSFGFGGVLLFNTHTHTNNNAVIVLIFDVHATV